MRVLTCHTFTMHAALGLLLLCGVAWAQETPDSLRALKHMCEVEELLVATFWNQTLATEGLLPEQVELFHEMRTRMKAGRCVYIDQAQALEDEEKALRVCIGEREKTFHSDFREAVASGDDALTELKKFNAHIESLKSKQSDTEAEERLRTSIAKLGQATTEHEGTWRELQESQTALNAKLAYYRNRLQVPFTIPAFEFPAGEPPPEFKEWKERYELQSVVNQARVEAARHEMEEAMRQAEEGMRTLEASVAELKAAVVSRKSRAVDNQ